MASSRELYPRESVDGDESRPLLEERPAHGTDDLGGDGDNIHGQQRSQRRSYAQRILTPLKNPESLSSLERLLLLLTFILVLLTAVFVGLYGGAQSRLSRGTRPGRGGDGGGGRGGDRQDQYVCTSSECVLAASELLHSIDTSIDPCDDFYEFSVGTWLKEHPIPGDVGIFGMAQQIGADNAKLMHKYLVNDEDDKAPAMHGEDVANLAKLRDFYSSCMNINAQDKAGAKPVVDLIKELRKHLHGAKVTSEAKDDYFASLSATLVTAVKGHGWARDQKPIPPNRPPARHPPTESPSPLPPRKGRQAGVTESLAWLHSQGLPALFGWSVEGEPVKDPKFGTAYLEPDGLGFPDKAYYNDKDEVEFYEHRVADAMHYFDVALKEIDGTEGKQGKDEKRKKEIAHLAREVVRFESEMADITPDGEDLEDPLATYNPTSLTSLSYKFSALDWPTYLSALTHKIPKAVIVRSPSYVQHLDALVSRTKTEVLEAYLAWSIIRSRGLQLGPNVELRRPIDALDRRSKGVDPDAREDRDTACFTAVNEAMGNLAGHFYVQEAFSPRARNVASEIIDSIIAAFKDRLPELAWLDPKTRKKAETKANAIRIKVGWPLSPNTTDSSAMATYYSDLHVDKADYFGNHARAIRRQTKREWSFVNRQLDGQQWDMIPSEVNAYYNPGGNEIVFPAGILQPQYFSETWPAYLQYGAFGNVAGHELSHAFDPAGRLFDEEGRLRDWWTNETAAAFNERRDCIVSQYAKYTIPDGKGGHQNLRSRFTIGEDVADAGGMAQSYRAWRSQYDRRDKDAIQSNPLLPGLNYTRDQLFFIAFGIGWARNIRTQEAVRRLRTDEHSPTKYRVIGTLSNNRDFARAFGCKAGKDRMARSDDERCEIW